MNKPRVEHRLIAEIEFDSDFYKIREKPALKYSHSRFELLLMTDGTVQWSTE